MKEKYEEEENKYILDKISERHKKYSINYNNYNFKEFNKLLKRKKLVYEFESFEKTKSMREMWLNRSKMLATFKNKFDKKKKIDEEKKEKENLENKKIKKNLKKT